MQPSSDLLMHRFNSHIPITGIIHIGAGNCEERFDYREMGVQKVLWIDGCTPFSSQTLVEAGFQHFVLHCWLSDIDDYETVYLTQMDSRNDSIILPLGSQKEVVVTSTCQHMAKRLTTLLSEVMIDAHDYNTLVIDVQGSELKVLDGCGTILDYMDFVVSECWQAPKDTDVPMCYETQPTTEQVTKVLNKHGLKETWCVYTVPGNGITERVITYNLNAIPRNVQSLDILTERHYGM